MSLRTKDSLNCPCNGIFKCGLHTPITYFVNPYSKEEMDKLFSLYLEKMPEFPELCKKWWRPLHLVDIELKGYD